MSFLRPDDQVVQAYLEFRDRVSALILDLPESMASLSVPLCPGWEVSALISHIVGVPEDILSGRMEGVTTEAWTQAQVDRHEGKSLAQLVTAWQATAEEFDVFFPHIPSPINSQAVMDAVTHEHDLRHAVGHMGAQDSLAVEVALGWLLDMGESKVAGIGKQLHDSDISRYELLRSLTGRRSVDQMNQLGLDGEQMALILQGTPMRAPTAAIEI